MAGDWESPASQLAQVYGAIIMDSLPLPFEAIVIVVNRDTGDTAMDSLRIPPEACREVLAAMLEITHQMEPLIIEEPE